MQQAQLLAIRQDSPLHVRGCEHSLRHFHWEDVTITVGLNRVQLAAPGKNPDQARQLCSRVFALILVTRFAREFSLRQNAIRLEYNGLAYDSYTAVSFDPERREQDRFAPLALCFFGVG